MLDGDLRTYLSAEVSSAGTNGGRISNNEVISGLVNNVWPNVSRQSRIDGETLHRKLFLLAASSTVEDLVSAMVRLFKPTPGDDWIRMFTATKTDVQSAWSPSRYFTAGWLESDVSIGQSSLTITVKNAAQTADFVDGDILILSDKTTPDAAPGNTQILTINGTPSVSTLDVTIATDETFDYAFTVAGNAFAASVMDMGTIGTSVDNYVVTTAGSGTFDDTNYPIITDNIGTVEDSLTLDFTTDDLYTCIGTSGTNYGTGDKGVDFSPTNVAKGIIYFTIPTLAFVGDWASGDDMTVDIHDASYPYVLRRDVPAACPSLANNLSTVVVNGESQS